MGSVVSRYANTAKKVVGGMVAVAFCLAVCGGTAWLIIDTFKGMEADHQRHKLAENAAYAQKRRADQVKRAEAINKAASTVVPAAEKTNSTPNLTNMNVRTYQRISPPQSIKPVEIFEVVSREDTNTLITIVVTDNSVSHSRSPISARSTNAELPAILMK